MNDLVERLRGTENIGAINVWNLRNEAADTIERLQAELAALKQGSEPITENTSDGYHTFKELYQFRKAYNVALFNTFASTGQCSVHKSWKHNDGELCFGGGWFIVVAVLPSGQISNHYEASDWDLFSVPETDKAMFAFDGHTGEDVIARLLAYTSPTPTDRDAWQPIETAPKDGTSFLVWRSGRFNSVGKTCWYAGEVLQESKELTDACTHWMPLPAAPTMQEGK